MNPLRNAVAHFQNREKRRLIRNLVAIRHEMDENTFEKIYGNIERM